MAVFNAADQREGSVDMRRLALLSLTVAGAIAGSAIAQEQPAAPIAPETPAAPAPAAPLATDLHYWAVRQGGGWYLARFDKYVTDMERTTRSWEKEGDVEGEALVLMTERKIDGRPVNAKFDHTQVLFSIRPAAARAGGGLD